MKTLAYVIGACVLMLISSCASVNKDELIGSWEVDHLEFSDKLFDTPAAHLISKAMRNRNYKFRKNGKVTFKSVDPEVRSVGKWKWIKEKLKFTMASDYRITEAEELGVIMHKFEVLKLSSNTMNWVLKLGLKRLEDEEVIVVLKKTGDE